MLGRLRHVVAEMSGDRGALVARPHQQASGDDGADLVCAKRQLGDHPEVPTPSPKGPEQVRVGVVIGMQDVAGCGHDLGAEQVVHGEPEPPLKDAGSATQCEAGDSRRADPAGHRGQAVVTQRPVDRPCQRPAPHRHGSRLDVYLNCIEAPYVDHEPVIAQRPAGGGMSAGPDRERESVLAGVRDGGRHVCHRGTPHHRPRAAADGSVEEHTGVLVFRLARLVDAAVDRCIQAAPIDDAHALLLIGISASVTRESGCLHRGHPLDMRQRSVALHEGVTESGA